MNKPSKEVQAVINDMAQTSRFQTFIVWIEENHLIAQKNLEIFEGAELHRAQGEAAALRTILTTTDGAYGSPERAGRVNTR